MPIEHPTVNGLVIPQSILLALSSDAWQMPTDEQFRRSFFPEATDLEHAMLYSIAQCRRETRSLLKRQVDECFALQLGSKSPDRLDPCYIILIGDLGIDRPIALDYRTSASTPRVAYLWGFSNCWVAAEYEIDELVDEIRRLAIPPEHLNSPATGIQRSS